MKCRLRSNRGCQIRGIKKIETVGKVSKGVKGLGHVIFPERVEDHLRATVTFVERAGGGSVDWLQQRVASEGIDAPFPSVILFRTSKRQFISEFMVSKPPIEEAQVVPPGTFDSEIAKEGLGDN
jgi:hypothetical protein